MLLEENQGTCLNKLYNTTWTGCQFEFNPLFLLCF